MTMMMEQDGGSPAPEMMQMMQMMKMMMGSGTGGTGDWICENCGSHQAASVQSCQMCGLPKVQEVFDQGFGDAGAGMGGDRQAMMQMMMGMMGGGCGASASSQPAPGKFV